MAFELLPEDLLLDILRRVVERDGLQALALGLGRSSRFLRAASWHRALYEEPRFSRKDSGVFIVAACQRMGPHIRRLCLSGLPQLAIADVEQCLVAAAPGLTHISLAFLDGRGATPQAFAFESLPPLPRLELFNAAAVGLGAVALDALLASCAGTLRHLYLPSANVGASPSLPVAALDIVVRHRLPELLSLDLADAPVSESALQALLAGDDPAAPQLRHLFLVRARLVGGGASGDGLARLLDTFAPAGLRVHVVDFHAELSKVVSKSNADEQLSRLGDLVARLPKDIPCAGLDGPNEAGRTPFLRAIEAGRLDVARRLVELGASPLCCTLPGPWRRQPRPWDAPHPMRGAAHPSHKAAGWTALHLAAPMTERGRAYPLEEWLEAAREWGLAALAEARTYTLGETPLQAINDSPRAVRLLVALGCDPAAPLRRRQGRSKAGGSLAHVYAAGDHGGALAALLAVRPDYASLKDDEGRTPLVRAAAKGAGAALRALLEARGPCGPLDLDLLAAGRDGRTALHFSPGGDGHGGATARSWRRGSTARPLEPTLAQGAFVQLAARARREALAARDARGRTPLIAAAERADVWAVRALLSAPAGSGDADALSVNAADLAGRTALHAACAGYQSTDLDPSFLEIAALLVERGADAYPAPRRTGDPSLLPAFLWAGARFGFCEWGEARREGLRRVLAAFRSRGLDADAFTATDEHGCTVFHYAAENKSCLPLKELLDACPDPRAALAVPNSAGRSPLALACGKGRYHFEAAVALLPYSDPLAQDRDGNCCLHLVPSDDFGYLKDPGRLFSLVSAILRRSPEAALLRNAEGQTPLHCFAWQRPWSLNPLDLAEERDDPIRTIFASPSGIMFGLLGRQRHKELCDAWEKQRAQILEDRRKAREARLREYMDKARRASEELVAASDVAAQDAAGRTPIHVAVAAASGPVEPLLAAMLAAPRARAALALRDRGGSTPLDLARRLARGRESVVRALREAGAPEPEPPPGDGGSYGCGL